MEQILKKEGNKLIIEFKPNRKKEKARKEIHVGEALHDSFYDNDGTLKSSRYIRREFLKLEKSLKYRIHL